MKTTDKYRLLEADEILKVSDSFYINDSWYPVFNNDIGKKLYPDNVGRYRRPLSDEDELHASYLGEPLPDLIEALDLIKSLLKGDCEFDKAASFVEKFNPPFNWDALWSSVASWHNWIACNRNGKWRAYENKPYTVTTLWMSGGTEIPKELAPPPSTDWKNSLVERPK